MIKINQESLEAAGMAPGAENDYPVVRRMKKQYIMEHILQYCREKQIVEEAAKIKAVFPFPCYE